VDRLDPEQVYERGWALTLLEGALERLREEQAAAGRAKEFERLTGFLRGEQPKIPYRDVAAELGISEAAVKVSLHRLRQRFGTLLREAIGETVTSPQEVDDRPLRPVLVLRPGAVPSHIPNVLPARGRALLRLRGGARRRGRGGGAAPALPAEPGVVAGVARGA
jgi:hypothetical protein